MLLTAVIAADAYIGPFGSESCPWLLGAIMGRVDLIGGGYTGDFHPDDRGLSICGRDTAASCRAEQPICSVVIFCREIPIQAQRAGRK